MYNHEAIDRDTIFVIPPLVQLKTLSPVKFAVVDVVAAFWSPTAVKVKPGFPVFDVYKDTRKGYCESEPQDNCYVT